MKRRVASMLLVLAMLLVNTGCGGTETETDTNESDNSTNTTGGDGADDSSDETRIPYDFPELDCQQGDFNILNCDFVWDMYTYLDFEEMTGEVLDDAIYERNRSVEDMFNVNLVVEDLHIDELNTRIQQTVLAGDDIYDVAYSRGDKINSIIAGGYVTNLYDVPGLNLDQPWWNQSVICGATIGDGDAVYFALNDFSLCAFDLVWCIFFNEDMLTSLGGELPYDLVREGKWTIDAMHELIKLGTNLNGDASFTFDRDGNSVYGLASYSRLVGSLLTGAGVRFTEKNTEGYPELIIENDLFYSTAEKLASIFGTAGDYIEANNKETGQNYEMLFEQNRALFLGGEIKSASVFRDMEDSFGIVPSPKYDESQESYYSWMNHDTPTMCIPASNADLETTGIVLDALSYLSYTDILPIYYSIRVSQKSLRNEDSIEMLGIIRDTLYYDASLTYGWTLDLYTKLIGKISTGDTNLASDIATAKSSVEEKIATTFELMND